MFRFFHRPLEKREKTGKEYGCFCLFEKLRYSNERSTKFESLYQEQKYLEEEICKMVALQLSPKIESSYGLGRQVKNYKGLYGIFRTVARLRFGQFSAENS